MRIDKQALTRCRGTALPMIALAMVALTGFLALAIDVGMLAIAKTQTQQAADLAALTAARTVNGNSTNNYNVTTATTNARNVLTYNLVLGQSIKSSQLQLTYGSYDYNQTTQAFSANYPPTTGQPDTAVAATVTTQSLPIAFGAIFGSQFLPNVSATAQAVHRPRDIALVMDLSGSMRFGTLLGFDFYTTSRTSNNPDPLYPKFGSYSSSNANMQGPSTNQTSGSESYTISPSNTTAANSSYALTYVNNFYQNAAYASPLIRAFDSYTSSDGGQTWSAPSTGAPQLPPTSYTSVPGGDVPLFKSGSTSTYATDVKDVIGSSTTNVFWELDGYSAYVNGSPDTSGTGGVPKVWTQVDYSNAACQFNGYTKGPGYYGKTFFLWPPDPRAGSITNTTTQAVTPTSALHRAPKRTDHSPATGAHTWARAPEHRPWPNLQAALEATHLEGRLPTATRRPRLVSKRDLLRRLPALQPGLSGGEQQRRIHRGLAGAVLRHQ